MNQNPKAKQNGKKKSNCQTPPKNLTRFVFLQELQKILNKKVI